MMGTKPNIMECFKNVSCISFIIHVMINVRKMLQMNIIMFE